MNGIENSSLAGMCVCALQSESACMSAPHQCVCDTSQGLRMLNLYVSKWKPSVDLAKVQNISLARIDFSLIQLKIQSLGDAEI